LRRNKTLNDLPCEYAFVGATLPVQWTRFFGREAETESLRRWIEGGEKLITLSGAGGSGKTRLAIETLRNLQSGHNRCVYFVALASLSDAGLLFSAIRDSLGIEAAPDVPPLEQIALALQDQPCVLLLDNLEQLGQNGAARLQELRSRLPQVTLLITSRALLRLPGEHELALAPLPTPGVGMANSDILASPSAALFCDRAQIVPGNDNAPAIAALCRRLDGIPLALELAAARARVLSPAQILERLEQRPDFLQTREVGVPERQRTLRATIEWSVGLLEPQLREFFARLSVFRGGWTLEAAESICAPGVCEDWETVDFLDQLGAQSLLSTADSSSSSTRFRQLEMLREWGESQLDETAQHELQARHYAFYTELVEQVLDPLLMAQCSDEMALENDNFRAALAWSLGRNDDTAANDAARLAGALCSFWEARAQHSEGIEWVERVLQKQGEIEPPYRARLCCAAALWNGFAATTRALCTC
jgi:predicted ATPase